MLPLTFFLLALGFMLLIFVLLTLGLLSFTGQVRLPNCRSRSVFNIQNENAAWGNWLLNEIQQTFDEKGASEGYDKLNGAYLKLLQDIKKQTSFSPRLGTVELFRYAEVQDITRSQWSEMNDRNAAKRQKMIKGISTRVCY